MLHEECVPSTHSILTRSMYVEQALPIYSYTYNYYMLFRRNQCATVDLILNALSCLQCLRVQGCADNAHVHIITHLFTHIGSTKARLLEIRQDGHLVLYLQERL